MSDVSFAAQQKKTTFPLTKKNKTPRLFRAKTCIKNAYLSPSKTLPSISTSSYHEQNQTANLKMLFNTFIDTLTKILSHNSASSNFRYSISSQSKEAQRLFSVFIQQASKQFSSSPVLQRGVRPLETVTKSVVQSSFIPFLKTWNSFACNCCEIQMLGPDGIKKTVLSNFEIISTSLDSILRKMNQANIIKHISPLKSINSLKQQMDQLKKDSYTILQTTNDEVALNEVSEKVKTFSRVLNDYFIKELPQCGLDALNLKMLRKNIYTACCDIISALRASYMFSEDMKSLLGSLDEFQDCLSDVLDRLYLPKTYIYDRSTLVRSEGMENTSDSNCSNEEEDFGFKNLTRILDLCNYGFDKINLLSNSVPALNNFLEQLQFLSNSNEESFNHLKEEMENGKTKMEEFSKKLNKEQNLQEIRMKEKENELTIIRNICKTQESEIEKLKNENKFKNCLIGIATKFEDFLHIDLEYEDDDDLISKVNDLIGTLINKKCKKCMAYEETEQKSREILYPVVKGRKNDDISFYEYICLVKERFDALNDEINAMKKKNYEVENSFRICKTGYKEILKSIGEDDSRDTNDAINIIKMKMKASSEIIVDNSLKERELKKVIANITKQLKKFVNEETDKSTPSDIATKAVIRMNEIQKMNTDLKDMNLEAVKRLTKLAKIEDEKHSLGILKLIDKLESAPNPLNDELVTANKQNKFLMSSLESINKKLHLSKKPTKEMIESIIKQIDKQKEDHKTMKRDLEKTKLRYKSMRESVEKNDSKLSEILGQEIDDIDSIDDTKLLDLSSSLISKISEKENDKSCVSIKLLDVLFRDVYDLVPVTNRSDPNIYIPEVNNALITLNSSIMALKPLATVLNTIFSKYDGKFESFLPGSANCNFLRQQIMQIHTVINKMAPKKMNSLIFLVITRFASFVSSLFSALTSISYSSADEQSKNFLFNIQEENEKLFQVVESNGLKF